MPRYAEFNKPEDYYIATSPFISGFYIAALVAAKIGELVEKEKLALTKLIKTANNEELELGFNERYLLVSQNANL